MYRERVIFEPIGNIVLQRIDGLLRGFDGDKYIKVLNQNTLYIPVKKKSLKVTAQYYGSKPIFSGISRVRIHNHSHHVTAKKYTIPKDTYVIVKIFEKDNLIHTYGINNLSKGKEYWIIIEALKERFNDASKYSVNVLYDYILDSLVLSIIDKEQYFQEYKSLTTCCKLLKSNFTSIECILKGIINGSWKEAKSQIILFEKLLNQFPKEVANSLRSITLKSLEERESLFINAEVELYNMNIKEFKHRFKIAIIAKAQREYNLDKHSLYKIAKVVGMENLIRFLKLSSKILKVQKTKGPNKKSENTNKNDSRFSKDYLERLYVLIAICSKQMSQLL